MDSMVDVYLRRAISELESAEILFTASIEKGIKEKLGVGEDSTFYSGVISHA